MIDPTSLSRAIDAAGYRLTAQRRAISQLISAHEGHFSAEDLLDEARRQGLALGRATVFRSLDVLIGLGLVERLELPSGGHAFVACRPDHHHHLVCSTCGRSADIAATGLSAILRAVEARSGYRIESHRLEVYGTCPDCRRRAERRSTISGDD
jgi:Fur family ferric uptake transcriptional regulator